MQYWLVSKVWNGDWCIRLCNSSNPESSLSSCHNLFSHSTGSRGTSFINGKEAQAIIKTVHHWKHYLTGKHFSIKTDQRSVAYMFDTKQTGKIKNDKIMQWGMELLCYSFDIIYQPGIENVPPDTLSLGYCNAMNSKNGSFAGLHWALCHLGVTWMYHFVKSRTLPYSMKNVKSATRSCSICAECKPWFH